MGDENRRVRIVSATLHGNTLLRGKDVKVFIVDPDGTECRLPNVKTVKWGVSGRFGLAEAIITVFDPELDVTVDAFTVVRTSEPGDAPLGADRDGWDANGVPYSR